MAFLGQHEIKRRIFSCTHTAYRHFSTVLNPVDRSSSYKSVIGLEVHIQLSSNSKLFSPAATDFSALVNDNVSLFDAAIPGTLPVLNKKCVELGLLISRALSCSINSVSSFDRKHYFYADLPAGYQITQQRQPLSQDGFIDFLVFAPGVHKEPYLKTSKVKQVQLEQDSGRSLHDETSMRSLIDLNRAGLPLVEVVFEPDLSDGEEAAGLIKELVLILERIKASSCKMEEGALRVDANVSVHKEGEDLGTRTEVKNIGSIRGVANAIRYETQRQVDILESGGVVENETRAWDAIKKQTVGMRDKETKQDYRYMPEPNLPPLRLQLSDTDHCEGAFDTRELWLHIPALPRNDRNELLQTYGLSKLLTLNLLSQEKMYFYFKKILEIDNKRNPKKVADYLMHEVIETLNKFKIELNDCPLEASHIGEIIDLLQLREITFNTAKDILCELLQGTTTSPKQMVVDNNWKMINDEEQLKKICLTVIENNPQVVIKYRKGSTKKTFPYLLKEVSQLCGGKANMSIVLQILKSVLEKSS